MPVLRVKQQPDAMPPITLLITAGLPFRLPYAHYLRVGLQFQAALTVSAE